MFKLKIEKFLKILRMNKFKKKKELSTRGHIRIELPDGYLMNREYRRVK
jgi:hypothetical protein